MKALKTTLLFAGLLSSSVLLCGQEKSFSNKDSVLKFFLNSPDVINHFIFSKPPKDSFVVIVDSGNNLVRSNIKKFGGLPIILDTSHFVIDSLRIKGMFSLKNRERNYVVLSSGKFDNKLFFSLFNPRTNGDCVIKYFRRKNLYYIEKISCGWF